MRKFNFKLYFKSTFMIIIILFFAGTLLYGLNLVDERVHNGGLESTTQIIIADKDNYMLYFRFFGKTYNIKMNVTKFLFSENGVFNTIQNAKISFISRVLKALISLLI